MGHNLLRPSAPFKIQGQQEYSLDSNHCLGRAQFRVTNPVQKKSSIT